MADAEDSGVEPIPVDDEGAGEDSQSQRRGSVDSSSRPFERASPVRTILSESPMAESESYMPREEDIRQSVASARSSVSSAGRTPTKKVTGPTFTVGSPDSPNGSPNALEQTIAASRNAAVRSDTTSSANTVRPAVGSPSRARPPPAVDTQSQGLRGIEVVEISPIAASPEDVDEHGLVGGLEKEQADDRDQNQDEDDDDDDDDDDMDDRDSIGADENDGGSDADMENTIGDEDDPDSDDSGRSAPRTFQPRRFKLQSGDGTSTPTPTSGAPDTTVPAASASEDKKGAGSDKVATSVSSTSSILSNRSNAGDAKTGLSRDTSSGKVCFGIRLFGFLVGDLTYCPICRSRSRSLFRTRVAPLRPLEPHRMPCLRQPTLVKQYQEHRLVLRILDSNSQKRHRLPFPLRSNGPKVLLWIPKLAAACAKRSWRKDLFCRRLQQVDCR
jgi:hypothetical protein